MPGHQDSGGAAPADPAWTALLARTAVAARRVVAETGSATAFLTATATASPPTASAGAELVATGRSLLELAGEALRLAWATEGAVEAAGSVDAGVWWLRVGEAVAEAADSFDLVPAAARARLGSGPAPAGSLADSPALRTAVRDLLAAGHLALRRYAEIIGDGRAGLAATLAAATTAMAAGAATVSVP